MIECKDVDYVLAIAKHGSISKASEELYISQPALTKYLKNLEERLGIELFYHDRRPLTLTPVGELYVNYSKQIAAIKTNLEKELMIYKNEDVPELHIGFSCTEIRPYIFSAVQKMRQNSPHVNLVLTELRSQEIERRLKIGQLDIGFITLPKHDPDIDTTLIMEEDILLGIPADHPLVSMGTPYLSNGYPLMDLSYFAHDSFVLREKGTRFSDHVAQLFEQVDYTPNIAVTARNNLSAIEFAEIWGLCVLTTRAFIRNLKDPNSMRFFVAGPVPQQLSIGVAHYHGKPLSVTANELISLIHEEILNAK
ncbi:MAG: LysR family transcriptional regulator [Lachnospiraceae bacterium]|nr:LysR family transcriptional regulator [Lachnospiraceae bacterium]